MADDRKFGEVATRLLAENELVRIWEMELEPGQASDLHEHHHDYVIVQVEGDRIAGVFEEDTKGEYPPGVVEGEVARGQSFLTKKGGIETAKNIGSKRYYEILVELK